VFEQGSSADRPGLGLSKRWKMAADGSTSASKAGAGVGMALGAIVGSVVPGVGTLVGLNVGFLVGFTVGSTVGTLTGYWDAVKEAEGQKVTVARDRLWSELQELRRAQQSSMSESLADLVAEYTTAAIRELENRIAQEREGVAEAVARLKAVRDRVEHAAQSRREELVAERAPLDRVLEKLGTLSTRVAALAAGTGDVLDAAPAGDRRL
jgi:phage tail tape-measure protein